MITTYILTGKRLNGQIEVQYLDGILNAVKSALNEPLNEKQFRAFADAVPMRERGLGELKLIGLHAQRESAPNEKLALFCRLYERHKKIKYSVSPADAGKIKLVRFDEPMLEAYFTSQNFLFRDKQTVSNLVRYYNELRAELAAGPKSKYPDHFSKEYQDKLPDTELKFYWAHLRNLGLTPKKDRTGNVIDWVKKELLQP